MTPDEPARMIATAESVAKLKETACGEIGRRAVTEAGGGSAGRSVGRCACGGRCSRAVGVGGRGAGARIVSSETILRKRRSRGLGSRCRSAARNSRSARVTRGSICCCRMASWWRIARISMSFALSLIGSSRMKADT